MALKVTNNASSTIAGSINTAVTAINLAGGTGSLFPTLGAGDWFWGTLVDASNNIEVVKVTARATDALTVVRAQDGTTAKSYAVGDRFELRPTAALFNDKADLASPSFTTGITTPAITLGATALTATAAEHNYLSGVTSAIQTQINAKAPLASPTFTGTVDLSATVLKGATPLAFDGATAGTNKTSFSVVDPTAARTITVPNADVDLTTVRAATTSLAGVTPYSTSAQVTAGTSTTTAATPSSLASASTISATGSYIYPGGYIEKWGVITGNADVTSAGTTYSATFDVAFPNAIYGAVGNIISFDAGTVRNIGQTLIVLDTTHVSFNVFEILGGGTQASWSLYYRVWGK